MNFDQLYIGTVLGFSVFIPSDRKNIVNDRCRSVEDCNKFVLARDCMNNWSNWVWKACKNNIFNNFHIGGFLIIDRTAVEYIYI